MASITTETITYILRTETVQRPIQCDVELKHCLLKVIGSGSRVKMIEPILSHNQFLKDEQSLIPSTDKLKYTREVFQLIVSMEEAN